MQEKNKTHSPQFHGHSFEQIRESIRGDAQELFNQMFLGGTAGIYVRDDFPIYFISEQLLHYMGYSYEAFAHKFDNGLLNTIVEKERKEYKKQLHDAYEKKEQFDFVCQIITKDGQARFVRDLGKYIITLDNEEAFLIVRSDITALVTQRKELESKIKENESISELDALAANLPGGVCQVEMDDCFTLIYGNDSFYNLYGYTKEEFETELHNHLIDIIYEKDLSFVQKTVFNGYLSQKKVLEFEHRVVKRDNSVIWILVRGSFTSVQQKTLFNCIVVDITTRKEMEEAIKISESRFRIALAQTDSTIFEYDMTTKIMIHSDRSAEKYGLQQITENVPHSLVKMGVVHKDTASDFLAMYQKVIDGAPSAFCHVKTLVNCEQRYAWRKISLTTIYDDDGNPIKAMGFLEDIDEQVRREDKLRYQSERDSLTGLYNRGTTVSQIGGALKERLDDNIAVMIIIDIDNFKSVNDTYGHMFGDYVLSESARRISSLFRKDEIIGRIGGDEFMAFIDCLPSKDVALSCAKRIAQTFETPFSDNSDTVNISCSIGIATFPLNGHSFSDLYQNADIALYEAKRRGRNQVLAFTPDIQPQSKWVPRSNTEID